MEKPFDELTRGQQFLRLLEIEYQDLLRMAQVNIANGEYYLKHYTLSPEEKETIQKNIRQDEADLRYYSGILTGIGGAENEGAESLTESHDSESPKSGLVDIDCTTVL